MLTEEQKKQLAELQLFRNKEGSVSIEVSFTPFEFKRQNEDVT